jgi:hypothetical protein
MVADLCVSNSWEMMRWHEADKSYRCCTAGCMLAEGSQVDMLQVLGS